MLMIAKSRRQIKLLNWNLRRESVQKIPAPVKVQKRKSRHALGDAGDRLFGT